MQKTVEVILSPALYPYRITRGNQVTVVIDILRFTSSLVAAFHFGVKDVIPVTSIQDAEAYKGKGFMVAAERDGIKLPFADFGNSMADFDTPLIKGISLVYCTTNGTVAMNTGANDGLVVALAFSNLNAVNQYIAELDLNVVVLCSGWKNLMSIEDTMCAGALSSILISKSAFKGIGDEIKVAIELWKNNGVDLKQAMSQTTHFKRLIKLGIDPLLGIIVKQNIYSLVPVYKDGVIQSISRSNWL